MGRESTFRFRVRKKGKGRSLLFPVALFLTGWLCGCAPEVYFEPCEPDPFATAIRCLRKGDTDRAISQLKALIKKPEHKCQAAFYLFAVDTDRKEYRDILLTDLCRDTTPAHARLVEQLVASQEELEQCGASLKNQKSRAEALKKDTSLFQEEISRLRFEMEKLEEIRREAEKWRLK